MAGSPEYLALLDDLKPTRPSYELLDAAWAFIEEGGDQEHDFRMLARIAMSIVSDQYYRPYRVEQDAGGAWETIIGDAKELHIAKNAGYAGADNPDPWANFRMCEAFGISAVKGVLVRMSDKKIRIDNLRKDPSNERVGEAIEDTLRDLAAYALIAICLMREAND